MPARQGRRVVDGRILYDFENLPVLIQFDPCIVWGRVTGSAHIAYDGLGAWWPDQIEFSSPRHPGPLVYLAVSDPLFDEIGTRLKLHRGEDIEQCIADRLVRVRRSLRVMAASPITGAAAGLACIAAVFAGLLCWSLPDPHRVAASTAGRLESPEPRR